MPIMDGYAATAELRRREGTNRRLPVIALTASALTDDRQRCLDAGMDDFIRKPIDPGELRTTLERWTTTNPSLGTGPDHIRRIWQGIAERLHDIRDGTPEQTGDLGTRLLTSFLSRTPGLLTDITTAIDTDDTATLEERAHSLSGAAGNIGANLVAGLSSELEKCARSGDLTTVAETLARLRTEADHLQHALAIRPYLDAISQT